MFWKPLFHTLTRLSIRLTWDFMEKVIKIILSIYFFWQVWVSIYFLDVADDDFLPCMLGIQCPNLTDLGTHGHYYNLKRHTKFHLFSKLVSAIVEKSLIKEIENYDQSNVLLFPKCWSPLIATYTLFFHVWYCTVLHDNSRSSVIFKHWVHPSQVHTCSNWILHWK